MVVPPKRAVQRAASRNGHRAAPGPAVSGLPAGSKVIAEFTTPQPGEPGHDAPPTVEVLERDDEMDALDDLAGPGTALVYRCLTGERRLVGRFDRTRIIKDHTIIGVQFGGGEYEVDFKESDGTYAKKFVRFSFDPLCYGEPKGPFAVKPTEPRTDNSAALDMMQKSIEAANKRADEAAARVDRIMEALLTRQPAAPTNPGLSLEQVFSLAERMNGGRGPSEDIAKGLAELKELAANAGTGEGGIPWNLLISKGLDLFSNLAARPAAPRPGAAPGGHTPARAGQPHQQTPGAAPVNNPPPPDHINAVVLAVKSSPLYAYYAPKLAELVNRPTSPEDAADEILGMVPDAFNDEVLAVVSRPDVVDYLALFEPELVNAHREWFKTTAEHVRQSFDTEPEPADDPAPT